MTASTTSGSRRAAFTLARAAEERRESTLPSTPSSLDTFSSSTLFSPLRAASSSSTPSWCRHM